MERLKALLRWIGRDPGPTPPDRSFLISLVRVILFIAVLDAVLLALFLLLEQAQAPERVFVVLFLGGVVVLLVLRDRWLPDAARILVPRWLSRSKVEQSRRSVRLFVIYWCVLAFVWLLFWTPWLGDAP